MPSSPPPASPRILLIRRRYLGDLILLGCVFRNLRLHWPDARLALLTESGYAAAAGLNPDINATFTFPRRGYQWPGFVRGLRRQRFTHVLDFDNTDKTALTARLTGAGMRVTQKRDTSPFRQGWAYTHVVPVANTTYHATSIVETYLALLQPLQVPVQSHQSRVEPSAADLAWARAQLGRDAAGQLHGPPQLLVHPGTRSRFRLWPAERFAELCDRLQDENNVQVILISGPGDHAFVRRIRENARTHLLAIEQSLSLGQLAALTSVCGLLLCHDSGPMHVAAAAGARVVALYGSQNATIWRPLGAGHTILQTSLPCTCLAHPPTPCVKEDSYRSYCVRKLSVAQVHAAVVAALKPAAPQS